MIEISKALKEIYLQPFDIRPVHVEEALRTPDIKQSLEFGGLEINLFMKTSERSTPPITLIALERILENNNTVIDSAYKTLLKPLGILEGTKPFEILKILADRFGVTLKVLNKEGKFIGKETITIPEGTNVNQIVQIKEKCSFMTSFYFRIKEGKTLEVAFAFAIKTKEYQEWLSSQK